MAKSPEYVVVAAEQYCA